MPDFSPTPRHRRDGHPVLALTGVIGVTAIAGLGVVLAVLPARDPAPSAARPVAADLGTAVSPARPAPGFPAAGPFFSTATAPRTPASERPETEPERAAERREETEEPAGRDDSESTEGGRPERERPARRRGALPPGHEAGASRSSGRPARPANPSSRSRPPSPVSPARSGGSDSTGTADRAGTGEAHRPRPARIAAPDASKPAVRGSATRESAAENTAGNTGENTAAKDAAARNSATTSSDGAARTRIEDPCLRFDDELRRAYCYEVLRRLGQ